MTERLLGMLLGAAVIVAAVQTWRIAHVTEQGESTTIEIRATNAGIALQPGDGEVSLHPAGQRQRQVARGRFREPMTVPPGRYDVRAVFARASDSPTRWSEESIVAEAGRAAVYRMDFAAGELAVNAPVAAGTGKVMVYVFAAGKRAPMLAAMPAGEPVMISPANYDIRVVLTEDSEEKMVRWRRGVPVKTGLQTEIEVPFERGTLKVAARNGTKVLRQGAVELTVYRAGEPMRKVVDTGLAGTRLHLPVGNYDVRAVFTAGSDSPERWLRDVPVEDDTETGRTVDFASGTLQVSAYLGDVELPPFQAYVYAYRAGQHTSPVAYAAAPHELVLEAGHYDVRVTFSRARDQPTRWLRNVAVPVEGTYAAAVRFDSGRLLVRAHDRQGHELIGDRAFVTVFAEGARHGPVAIARAGELVTLTEGIYDVRIDDTTQPSADPQWRLGVHVETGQRFEMDVIFQDR